MGDPTIQALAAATYLMTSLCGLLLYLLFVTAIANDRTNYQNNPFYIIVYHLSAGDIGLLLTNLFVAFPLTIAGRDVYGQPLFHILASGQTIFFYVLFFSSFILALNRFVLFVLPRLHEVCFTGAKMQLVMLTPWMVTVVHTAVTTFVIDCPKSFNYDNYHFLFACNGNTTSELRPYFMNYLGYLAKIGPVVMMALYAAIYMHMCCGSKGAAAAGGNSTASKYQTTLLIQSVSICGVLWVYALAFWFIPKMTSSPYGPVLITNLSAVNSFVNPIIFIIFNQQVRRSIQKLFGGASTTNMVAPFKSHPQATTRPTSGPLIN